MPTIASEPLHPAPIEQPTESPVHREPRHRKPGQKSLIRVAQGQDIELKPRHSGYISLNHHEAHCSICRHPQRADIDQAFLHWWRPTDIAAHFKLDRLTVYRHAHALGLFRRRAARTQHALGCIIEQAETVTATADSIIRAVRAHACLDENGRWHEPRKEVIVTHQYVDLREPPDRPVAAGKPAPRKKSWLSAVRKFLDTPAEQKTV